MAAKRGSGPSTIPGTGVSSPAPGRQFRPYVHPGDAEPPEVTAARKRHQALNAEIERARAVPLAATEPAAPPVAAAPPPAVRCEACGYLITAIGHRAVCDD